MSRWYRENIMKRIFVYMVIICIAVTGLAGCGKKGAGEKAETIPVRVMKVEPMDLSVALEYVGTVKGEEEAIIYPKVPGKILEKVKQEMSAVKKGEPILYIDRDEVGLKFEKAPVESPIEGIVSKIYVDIGTNVTPQTPVAHVAKIDRAEIHMEIPEKYLPKLKLGQAATVTVDAYPGKTFTGTITQISNLVDTQTRAAPIEITIDNKDLLLQSGMFAKTRIVIEEHKEALGVMREALIGKEPDVYLYVIESDKAFLRKVKTGVRQGSHYEVLEGLKKDDNVVIMGQQRLRDGSSVTVETENNSTK